MNKEELLKKLTTSYKRSNWKDIVNAIFPNREFYATEETVEITKQAQRDLTEKMIRFGNINLDDGNAVALYEVELKPNSTNLSRNRVGLRNLITSEIIPGFVDGALIVYHQKGHDDWRFSFFSKTKYWDEEGNEIKKETHPKRYTYVLGKGETCVTPLERFWFLIEKRTRTIKDILEAFSVERVSNEFFAKYKKHYQAFVDDLMRDDNHQAKSLFGTEHKLIRDFVKKMLGRLVFLQFLQKKGWLDVSIDKHYGQGNKNFLHEFFQNNQSVGFYSTCLVPLFFDSLNNSNNKVLKVTGTKFPYLNGGLFERDEIEKKTKADLLIFKTELFEKLFDFFGEYNFTIDESTPDDLDVGIDPEMLGHIFENLLEENHSKGAYYTPKLIVQYMCQEVLIQYLELHLGKDDSVAQFVRYKDRGDDKAKDNFIHNNATKINNLLDNIKICDPAIGSGAFPMGLLQEIFHAKLALDWTLIEKKGEIKRAIIQNSIYGVDKDKGAVDIARLRFWLSLIVDEEVKPGEEPQPLPNFDYKIMQGDSLFESFKGIPLKFEAKPSTKELQKNLFGIVEEPQLLVYYEIQKDLVKLEHDLYNPANNNRKEEIRNKIDLLVAKTIENSIKNEVTEKEQLYKVTQGNLTLNATKKQKDALVKLKEEIQKLKDAQQEIKQYSKKDEKPYFLWHLYFKEVFDEGGFDIVIGNPPYIRQELITDIKPYLESLGGKSNYEVYNSTSDIYTYFFELGHKILKSDKSVFSYICSKKYTRAKYGQNLRKFLLEKTQISGYIDFNEVQVFGATVDTSIIFFQRKNEILSDYSFIYCKVGNDLHKNEPLIDYINKSGSIYHRKYLNEVSWSFANNSSEIIKKIIESGGKPVKQWKDIQMNYGIKTGYNDAFWITPSQRNEFISQNSKSSDIIKRLIRGRDISKYKYDFQDKYLLFIPWHFPLQDDSSISGASKIAEQHFKTNYPEIYNHLLKHKEKLENRNKVETGIRYEWYALQRFGASYYKDFEKNKLIWLSITDKSKFAFDFAGGYISAPSYFLIGANLKYYISIFNSKIIEWYLNTITSSTGQGTNQWTKVYMEQLPIPEISKSEMHPFEILVDYITYIKKDSIRISPYAPNEHMAINFEELVDACVYELFFKDHMQEKGITVLKDVTELLRPIDTFDEITEANKITKIINDVYDEYKSSNNIIRRRILDFPVKSPDIINIIQNG